MGKHAIFLLPQQGVFIFGQLPQLPHLPPFSFVSRPPAACRIAWGEAGPWAWRADWPTVGSDTTRGQIPAGGGLAANRARTQRHFSIQIPFPTYANPRRGLGYPAARGRMPDHAKADMFGKFAVTPCE